VALFSPSAADPAPSPLSALQPYLRAIQAHLGPVAATAPLALAGIDVYTGGW
jgi:hypothetical protein